MNIIPADEFPQTSVVITDLTEQRRHQESLPPRRMPGKGR